MVSRSDPCRERGMYGARRNVRVGSHAACSSTHILVEKMLDRPASYGVQTYWVECEHTGSSWPTWVQVLEGSYRHDAINDHFWTVRAEAVPDDQLDPRDKDKLLQVCHVAPLNPDQVCFCNDTRSTIQRSPALDLPCRSSALNVLRSTRSRIYIDGLRIIPGCCLDTGWAGLRYGRIQCVLKYNTSVFRANYLVWKIRPKKTHWSSSTPYLDPKT